MVRTIAAVLDKSQLHTFAMDSVVGILLPHPSLPLLNSPISPSFPDPFPPFFVPVLSYFISSCLSIILYFKRESNLEKTLNSTTHMGDF